MILHRTTPRRAISRFAGGTFTWKYLAICAAVIAALLAFTPATWAQENATVNGTVTDASGAVIPNATVNLSNSATGQVRTVTSNSVGAYRFANVGIGTYTLTVAASGFAKYTKTGIVVNVAQTVEANATLNVGSQAQTVTVAAQALQVQTETSEVSTLISGQQVERLATNGRNIVQLAALGMGVANTLPSFGGVNALTSANGISFNGTRTTHNIYLLDGGELNDRGCGGCYMVLPSQDAIAEFQTLDSNYSPDYGIGSGGTITMVIKSGTRRFHGEVYEFNRNTDYNANDYFNKQAGRSRPAFQLNEPGFNLGGPLFIPHVYNQNKTRTFFFFNEEWRRLIQGSAPSKYNTIIDSDFPTAGQALDYTLQPGDKPANKPAHIPLAPNLPNNSTYTQLETNDGLTPGQPFPETAPGSGVYVIPANMLDPNAVLEVNAGTFPHANSPDGTQYIASIKQPTNVREDAVRIDHAINSKLQLMGHFIHDAVQPSFFPPLWQGSYPTVGTTMQNPSYTSVIKLTQTYSPNLLNETSFNYSGNKILLTPIAGAGASILPPSGWNATSFFPAANNAGKDMPAITFSGTPFGATWSESYFPWKNGYEGFEYRDDLSWIKGRHQLKFGASWLHDYKNQQLQANTQGTANFSSSNKYFSGNAYVDFMLGLANSFTQLEYLYGKHWVNNNYGFYVNDNWHVNSKLVLNVGIRFDGMPHAFERYDKFANFVPADYDTTLGNPFNADKSTLNTAQLTSFNGELFYLNGIRQAGKNGFPRGNVKNDYKTWQPRIGFAYDLFGNGRTVLRGGFGTFYERVQGNDVYNAALNPPFAYQPSANNVMFSHPNIDATTGQVPETKTYFPSTMTTIKYHYPNPGTAMYSLGVQHQIAPSIIAVVQYVGSDGWDQNNDRRINTLALNDLTDRQAVAGGASANPFRIYKGFASINQEENETNFNYNSLQAGFRAENRHGLTTQLSYTWSHNIDIGQNDLAGLTAPFNPSYDKGGDAGYDHRHIFNASYVYDLPFFRQQGNLAEKEILGGWSISGITQAQVGTPINTSLTGTDTVGLGDGGNRPDLVSKVSYLNPKKAVNGSYGHWFDKSSFAVPLAAWAGSTTNGYGTARKDTVVGPGLINWNLSLFKTMNLSPEGGVKLDLRFESFNTFNHTNFTSVDLNYADSNFGSVTADYGPRTLELGGKITF